VRRSASPRSIEGCRPVRRASRRAPNQAGSAFSRQGEAAVEGLLHQTVEEQRAQAAVAL
jgi:hypothetical protein